MRRASARDGRVQGDGDPETEFTLRLADIRNVAIAPLPGAGLPQDANRLARGEQMQFRQDWFQPESIRGRTGFERPKGRSAEPMDEE